MVSGNKLAKIFRKEDRLLIKRGENLWVSDTYVMVKLTSREGDKFLEKWNKYKTTADIPDLKKGDTYQITTKKQEYVKDQDPLGHLIDEYKYSHKELIEVEITNISAISENNIYRLYKYGDEIGVFNHKYSFIIDSLNSIKVKTEGYLNPLLIENEAEEIEVMLMPVRKENLMENIKKIAG